MGVLSVALFSGRRSTAGRAIGAESSPPYLAQASVNDRRILEVAREVFLADRDAPVAAVA
jgi:hypothetical protein